jgi:hypothetical protein
MTTERINYTLNCATSGNLIVNGITTGNINFTGSLYQNGSPYVGSQFTTTSGNVSYTSGTIVGTSVSATNMISTNQTTGTLVVSSGITTSNINFTGSLSQNGSPYIGSQFTITSGNVSYTNGSIVGTLVSATNMISTNQTTGTLIASSGITAGNINFTGSLYQNGALYTQSASLKGFQISATTGNSLTARSGVTFIAVGQDVNLNNINTIAYSNDGINWTGIGTSIFSVSSSSIEYSSILTRWVAGGNGTNALAYSNNGITWTGLGTSILSYTECLAYNGSNRWVAVGGGTYSIAYSTDGISWSGVTGSIFTNGSMGIAYGNGKWVAVGNGTNSIAYSLDGISWTGVSGKSIFSSWGAHVAYGNGKWVAVGAGTNTIAYSSDGISWTGLGMSIFYSAGMGISYGNGRWIAVGGGGGNSIAYSSDGISWTGLGNILFYGNKIVYSADRNRWVAVGKDANGIVYSSDGISWTGVGTSIFSNGRNVASTGNQTRSLIVAGQIVQYDTNNNYNNTTGTFTAPISGMYTVYLNGTGNVYITSANTFIPTQGNYTTNAYISSGNTLKCIVGDGDAVYNWGISYI